MHLFSGTTYRAYIHVIKWIRRKRVALLGIVAFVALMRIFILAPNTTGEDSVFENMEDASTGGKGGGTEEILEKNGRNIISLGKQTAGQRVKMEAMQKQVASIKKELDKQMKLESAKIGK
jgi:hypothetical protein